MLTRHSFIFVSVCLLAFNSVSFYWCLESPNVHINKFIGILVWWPKQQTIEWFHCCYCVLRYFSVGSGLHAHTARIAIEIDRFVLMLPRCDSVLLHWNHIYNYYIAIVYGNWRFYSFGISTMCATTAAINSNLMECINVLKKIYNYKYSGSTACTFQTWTRWTNKMKKNQFQVRNRYLFKTKWNSYGNTCICEPVVH